MPVRSRIHSSVVSIIFSRSKLVTTFSGRYEPVPAMHRRAVHRRPATARRAPPYSLSTSSVLTSMLDLAGHIEAVDHAMAKVSISPSWVARQHRLRETVVRTVHAALRRRLRAVGTAYRPLQFVFSKYLTTNSGGPRSASAWPAAASARSQPRPPRAADHRQLHSNFVLDKAGVELRDRRNGLIAIQQLRRPSSATHATRTKAYAARAEATLADEHDVAVTASRTSRASAPAIQTPAPGPSRTHRLRRITRRAKPATSNSRSTRDALRASPTASTGPIRASKRRYHSRRHRGPQELAAQIIVFKALSAMAHPLVLASTSPYRAELLRRLGLPFEAVAPGVDESSQGGESPGARALRLAQAKAQAVAARYPGSWVIGSDQVADLDGRILGKPGDAGRCRAQLAAESGRVVVFHTAAVLLRQGRAPVRARRSHLGAFSHADRGRDRALRRARPTIRLCRRFPQRGTRRALFESMETRDPAALVGLPLIWLAGALRAPGSIRSRLSLESELAHRVRAPPAIRPEAGPRPGTRHRCPAIGMRSTTRARTCGASRAPASGVALAVAVLVVARDGVSRERRVDANLVRAPGADRDVHERCDVPVVCNDAEVGERDLAGSMHAHDTLAALARVGQDGRVDRLAAEPPAAGDQCRVMLLDRALAQQRVRVPQGRTRARDEQASAGVAIEPVHELEGFLRAQCAQRLDRAE